jgi:hypothetical protein
MAFIPRPDLLRRTLETLERYPVTLILGPRQCGKTTLARQICDQRHGTYFDLEDPTTPLQPDVAQLTLRDRQGLVVIDEFQRQPELFALLRVLADRRPLPAHFLILGSASPQLVKGVSESLAGRVAFIDMGGFSCREVGSSRLKDLWIRGGFPNTFLAADEEASVEWRENFIRTFLERDIPQLGIRIPATTLRRFWTMLAHLHGQVWNAAELARALGSKEDTARRYLDILSGAFMIRQLPPCFENTGKRLVKAAKIYFRDTGLLHVLLGLRSYDEVASHPIQGFSWEGFALEQVVRLARAERDAFFYKTHGGAELDLLLVRGGRRYGFEFKYSDAPRSTRGMHIVMEDLRLQQLWVVYPGTTEYSLKDNIGVVPLGDIERVLGAMG